MSDFTFEFYDAFEFAELMAASPQVVEAEITTATDRVAIYGMGVSIKATPWKTGHLRRSHAQIPTSYSAGYARGGWGNAVPYAEYVEEGRGPVVAKNAKALAFTVKGGGLIFRKRVKAAAAQPFMEPGREAAESRMDAEFSGAITRIVEALGG